MDIQSALDELDISLDEIELTKLDQEFIKKNGEFTVNIALVKNGRPILGVIFVPVEKTLYFADVEKNKAFKTVFDINRFDISKIMMDALEIRPRPISSKGKIVVGSRSHMSPDTEDFVRNLKTEVEKVEIVSPSISILAEPPVAVVDKNVERKGTRKVAEAYLNYLYTDEGQDIAGKNFYRPINEKIKAKFEKSLPKIPLFTIEQAFGGWEKADKDHFADGGSFDQIYLKK